MDSAVRKMLATTVAALGFSMKSMPFGVTLSNQRWTSKKSSKNYPFSSTRQEERFRKNYTSNSDGTIIALNSRYK